MTALIETGKDDRGRNGTDCLEDGKNYLFKKKLHKKRTMAQTNHQDEYGEATTPPRPPNAWILYRSHKVQEMRAFSTAEVVEAEEHGRSSVLRSVGLAEVSRLVSYMWKAEPESVKRQWSDWAGERKRAHQELFPDYKYRPRRKSTVATVVLAAEKSVVAEGKKKKNKEKSKKRKWKRTTDNLVSHQEISDKRYPQQASRAEAAWIDSFVLVDKESDLVPAHVPEDPKLINENEAQLPQQISSEVWSFALAAVGREKKVNAMRQDEDKERSQRSSEVQQEYDSLVPQLYPFSSSYDTVHPCSTVFSPAISSQSPPSRDRPMSSMSTRPVRVLHYPYVRSDGESSAFLPNVTSNTIPMTYWKNTQGKHAGQEVMQSPPWFASHLSQSYSSMQDGDAGHQHNVSSLYPRLLVGGPTVALSPWQLSRAHSTDIASTSSAFRQEGHMLMAEDRSFLQDCLHECGQSEATISTFFPMPCSISTQSDYFPHLEPYFGGHFPPSIATQDLCIGRLHTPFFCSCSLGYTEQAACSLV